MSDPIADYVARPFGTFAELVKLQTVSRPNSDAIVCEGEAITYGALDALADRVAAALQRDGVEPLGVTAICAAASIKYAAVFIGTLRAGAAISPLAPSATPEQLVAMLADNGASHVFVDAEIARQLAPIRDKIAARWIALEDGTEGKPLDAWLAGEDARPAPVKIAPDQAFNIIYSSGTTGMPKGIVQPYAMRWNHVGRGGGYGPGSVTMISTGLYSNTTLVVFLPALATGGTVVLMPKFDARRFLELSERYRANYAMLVPIQYRRILDVPDFDRFDLSSYIMK